MKIFGKGECNCRWWVNNSTALSKKKKRY